MLCCSERCATREERTDIETSVLNAALFGTLDAMRVQGEFSSRQRTPEQWHLSQPAQPTELPVQQLELRLKSSEAVAGGPSYADGLFMAFHLDSESIGQLMSKISLEAKGSAAVFRPFFEQVRIQSGMFFRRLMFSCADFSVGGKLVLLVAFCRWWPVKVP